MSASQILRPAPTALRQQIAAECQLVIEGLAD